MTKKKENKEVKVPGVASSTFPSLNPWTFITTTVDNVSGENVKWNWNSNSNSWDRTPYQIAVVAYAVSEPYLPVTLYGVGIEPYQPQYPNPTPVAPGGLPGLPNGSTPWQTTIKYGPSSLDVLNEKLNEIAKLKKENESLKEKVIKLVEISNKLLALIDTFSK